MARNLTTQNEIREYVDTVTIAARHHAPNVENIIPELETAVLNRLNLSVDKIKVYERNGNLARTCWITFASKRYAFSYSYATDEIELKQDSLQGVLIATFSNSSNVQSIKTLIQSL
jgi:hypothetical protein